MVTLESTPMDSPLYRVDPDRGIEYWGCRAVVAAFTVAGDVDDLVPRGLHVDQPAIGAVMIAEYGASTLGPYGEFVSLLRVVDDDGAPGLYIPYIYVTNDAALAAGREVLGAPKKLASIAITRDGGAVVGTLARPEGLPLATVAVSPAERLPAEVLDALIPAETPFYSLRHLPGPPGGAQVHELVRWSSELATRRDAFGDDLRFSGPGSLTYPTGSGVDPVHRLGVDSLLATVYFEFDMHLRTGSVVWSDTRVASEEELRRPAPAGAT